MLFEVKMEIMRRRRRNERNLQRGFFVARGASLWGVKEGRVV